MQRGEAGQPAAQSVPVPVPKTLWGVGANQTKVGGDAILGRYLNKTGPGGLDQAVKPPADMVLHSECLCRSVCGHGNLACLAALLACLATLRLAWGVLL